MIEFLARFAFPDLRETPQKPRRNGFYLRSDAEKILSDHGRQNARADAGFRRERQIPVFRFEPERFDERIQLGRFERRFRASFGRPARSRARSFKRRGDAVFTEPAAESGSKIGRNGGAGQNRFYES